MKRFVFSILFTLCACSSFAQLNGDGYYRVRNAVSDRYIILRDNKGKINVSTTSADLGAVELWKNFTNVVSDPGSILYIQKTSSGGYRLKSQGTDTYEIIGHDLLLKLNKDGETYKAYQTLNGNVIYLCDSETSDEFDEGKLNTNDKGTNYRNWYILPVGCDKDEYFGVTPSFAAPDGNFYTTFYASFPFEFASEGMTAYYIKLVDEDMAVIEEVKDGKVPAATPVIIKCSSENPADNKLNICSNSASEFSSNALKGVYFNNKYRRNRTAFDCNSMRIFGVKSDGELGFVTPDLDYVPANSAYLQVPAGTPSELRILTNKEYQDVISGVESVTEDVDASKGVYTFFGVKVADSLSELENLPKGFYIVGGKKIRK